MSSAAPKVERLLEAVGALIHEHVLPVDDEHDGDIGADQHDAADLVMLSDPRLRTQMIGRWVERFSGWLAVPDDLPASERARLHAARLLADGCWFADATGFLPIPDADRDAVLDCALALLDGVDA